MVDEVTYMAYGRPALDALRTIVAEVKKDDPMAPVIVLVPNNIAGIVARRFLAHGLGPDRCGIAAIRFTTLRHLAEQLAAPVLAGAARRPATSAVTAAAVRACRTPTLASSTRYPRTRLPPGPWLARIARCATSTPRRSPDSSPSPC